MTWPPDPVEMVWVELDRRAMEKQPTSAQQMWELLQDCRKRRPSDDLMKLVDIMPRVCKATVKAKDKSNNMEDKCLTLLFTV